MKNWKTRLHILSGLVLLASGALAQADKKQSKRDVTLETGLVGICYSAWFNPVVKEGLPIYNITTILKENPANPKWGPVTTFHYWAEPAVGYYRSDNREVIRQHMKLLSAARIDFIVLDNTNMNNNWPASYKKEMIYDSFHAFFETLKAMKQEGLKPPHVVIWCPSSCGNEMYQTYYANPAYQDLFLYWNEGTGLKPLLLTTDAPASDLQKQMTVRKMWGLQRKLAEKEWSFLQRSPQNLGKNGATIEQVSVATAMQETYMTAKTAVGRKGGLTFQEQWKRAFDVRPKFITITWWNEWIAQRFDVKGKTMFVDNYTREFSRDIEPMKGGHADLYYQFMKSYIEAYKNSKACPMDLLEPNNL